MAAHQTHSPVPYVQPLYIYISNALDRYAYALRKGVLEKALSKRFQTYVPVVAAGRTDTGVHSVGQAIHFDLPNADEDLGQLTYSMNQMMPEVRETVLCPVAKTAVGACLTKGKSRKHDHTISARAAAMRRRRWLPYNPKHSTRSISALVPSSSTL